MAAPIRLPRLRDDLPLVTKEDAPHRAFTRFWNEVVTQIENNLNDVIAAQEAAEAAQDAADTARGTASGAQAAADAAQASADAAQVDADTANAGLAALGTAAQEDTGSSGHTLPFCDVANTFADVTATRFRVPSLTDAADDTAAAGAGVAIGEVYRTGSALKVRVT